MDALTALADWIHVVALALWAGSLVVLLLVAPGGRRVRREDVALLDPLRQRSQSVAWWALIALIATLAVEILARGAALTGNAGLGGFIPSLKQVLFTTRFGVASAAQWVLLVVSLYAVDEFGRAPAAATASAPRPGRHALGIVAPAMRRMDVTLPRDTWVRIAALLAGAVLLCTAIAGPFGASVFSALVEAVHLGATMVWLGGAIVLAATVPAFIDRVERARRPLALLALLDRFTPVAMLSVMLLVVTGLWEAGHTATAPGSRVSAAVQLAMTLKTLLLLGIVGVSVWGLYGPRPRLRRQSVRLRRDVGLYVGVEAALRAVLRPVMINAGLAGVALLCGAIAATAPGVAASAARRHAGLSVIGQAGPIAVTLAVAPDALGRNTFTLRLRNARGQAVTGATVLVEARSPREGEGGPGPTLATELGAGRYRSQAVFSGGGRWEVHVSIRTGTTMATALFRLNVVGASAPAATATPPAARATPAAGGAAGAWQQLGPVAIAHALVADPAEKNKLYEGTVSGVYRSLDGGKHWSLASAGLSGSSLSVWSLTHLPDGSLLAATGGGIYRSVDGAAHWRITGLGTRSIYTIATHQAGHVVLLAGGDGGIFRSDDMAAHWHAVYTTGAAAVASLAWPAIRPSLVVAGINPGPNPVVVSNDGGATWHVESPRLPPIVGMMSVAVAPGARVVYAGSMGLGAYLSQGPGGTWLERNTGLPGLKTDDAHIASFAFTPANPAVLYAATDYGVYRSMDAGQHWAPFGTGLTGDATVVTALTLVTGPHPVLYATTAAGLYRYPLVDRRR